MHLSILLVDDSSVVRYYLRRAIELNREWKVCGEAANGAVALEMLGQIHPHVVIVDLQMPVMGGLEAARRITQIAPSTLILMFTMHDSEQLSQAAQAAGIQQVFSKSGGTPGILNSLTEFALNGRHKQRLPQRSAKSF